MNERIRELMAQAGFDPAAIERMGVMPNAEKFAELIIRECAKAIDTVYEKSEPDHGCYDWATWAYGEDILEHFGIEK